MSQIPCSGAVCWEMLESSMRTTNLQWVGVLAAHICVYTPEICRLLAISAAEGSLMHYFPVMSELSLEL